MNLSETAFVECCSEASPEDNFSTCTRFNLRWFTPAIEVRLCGHATIAAAAAVFHGACNQADCLYFNTLSGELSVSLDIATGMLAMDLPLLSPSTDLPCPDFTSTSELVQAAVGNIDSTTTESTTTESTNTISIDCVMYEPSLKYLVIFLGPDSNGKLITRQEFELLRPDIRRMEAAHSKGKLVGVVLTVAGGKEGEEESGEYDFLSRFFGPWAGIDEDPVTGSAHSVLGPVWAEKLGKKELAARQCSKRGGDLKVVVEAERGRVTVLGNAFMVFKGEMMLE